MQVSTFKNTNSTLRLTFGIIIDEFYLFIHLKFFNYEMTYWSTQKGNYQVSITSISKTFKK